KAVGAVLGLGDRFVDEMIAMAEDASQHEFSNNRIDNWILGMGQTGLDAPMQQKLDNGLQMRIDNTVKHLQAQVNGNFEVPKPIHDEEIRVAKMLDYLAPVQRQSMFELGYEIAYTPDYLADKIAHFSDIFGLNRKTSNNPTDLVGTYRVYVSGHGNTEDCAATFVHECAHNFWPAEFSPEEVAAMDQRIESDAVHIQKLHDFLNDVTLNQYGQTPFEEFVKLHAAYKAGSPEAKPAVIAEANKLLSPTGLTVDGIFPHLSDPLRLKLMTDRAYNDLRIEGKKYKDGGYNDIPSRMREMISRFAELKQVRLHGEPELLNFIAPGMDDVFDHYYLPHLERVVQKLHQFKAGVVTSSDQALRSAASPALIDSASIALPAAAAEDKPIPSVGAQALPATPAPSPTAPKPSLAPEQLAAGVIPPMPLGAFSTTPSVPLPSTSHTNTAHANDCKGCSTCRGDAGQRPTSKITGGALASTITHSPNICALGANS
ncbi:MAG: hypothetical protein B7X34_08165, partial [Acidobacteriia bacterium 12-62-4]